MTLLNYMRNRKNGFFNAPFSKGSFHEKVLLRAKKIKAESGGFGLAKIYE